MPIRLPAALTPLIPSRSIITLVPLFYASLLFIAGITLGHAIYLRPAVLLAGLVPLAVVAVWAILRAERLAWLPIALVWIVLGAWCVQTEPQPVASPAVTTLADGLLRTVQGTVTAAGSLHPATPLAEEDPDAPPAETAAASQRVDLDLTAAEVVTHDMDELRPLPKPSALTQASRLRLTLHWPAGQSQSVACGQRLQAVVRLTPPDTYMDPGVWNQAAYLEAQGVAATASVSTADPTRFTLLGTAPANSLPCLLNRWQQQATTRIESLPTLTRRLPAALRIGPDDAAMLAALVAGDRGYLNRNLRVGFERTGSFHLVVVSGLHLAILAGCVFAVARRLRLGRLPATFVTLALALAYALFTGWAIPAQRSFWMITLYLAGRLLYRDRNPLNVIGFATICLLAASPGALFEASLQMTLLSVAAIAGVALPLLERTLKPLRQATSDLPIATLDPKLPHAVAQFRLILRVIAEHLEPALNHFAAWRLFPWLVRASVRMCELVFLSLIVELALALPMALYFHRITVYALPVNLAILPLLALLIPAAMLLLVLLAIWPAAAVAPAALCAVLLHMSTLAIRWLGSRWLADVRIPAPTPGQLAAAVCCFIAALLLARGLGPAPRVQRRLAFAAMLAMVAIALWPRPIARPANALLFQAIDVGQGDSMLLISPDGKTMLVDGGGLATFGFAATNAAAGNGNFDIGEEVVSSVLWARGIRHLDVVALSHAHQDHMGGLPAVLRNFHPAELWVGNNPHVASYNALLRQAAELGIRVRSLHAGDTPSLGQVSFRVLAPQSGYQPGPEPKNDDSLVLKATYGQTSLLLPGDAEAPEEAFMLTEPELRSTVLKVGHHGSVTSTRPAFLAQVAPHWAVISCGRHNHFGHPRPEILAELQAAHVFTMRTDTGGTACFVLDGRNVTAQPLCLPPSP